MTRPKAKALHKKNGAPRLLYDDYIGADICRAIATSTKSMRNILKDNPHFPGVETINGWRLDVPRFGVQYAVAKMQQAELFAEEVIEISDDNSKDLIVSAKGESFNSEFAARSRLRIDTRKWVACKLAPKIYGDMARGAQEPASKEDLAQHHADLSALIKKHAQDH